MRAVVQRVKKAAVSIDETVKSSIDEGFLVYLGISVDDNQLDIDYLVEKIAGLRVFPDQNNKMNLSLTDITDIKMEILVISQFTLYGDVRKGRRPSYIKAMDGTDAKQLYIEFIHKIEKKKIICKTGEFGADMQVESINNGPVTILLDSTRLF